MYPDWTDRIDDLLQVPYAYCIHNLDKDSKSEHRKDHVHIIVVFSNTTTYNHALEVLQSLSLPGKKAFNTVQPVFSIRHVYDYLIHDTDKCRSDDKYQYDKSDRITGNNFDIGSYEQISVADKDRMAKDVARFIIDNDIENFVVLYCQLVQSCPDIDYEPILRSYSGYFERLCKGIYLINHPFRKDSNA